MKVLNEKVFHKLKYLVPFSHFVNATRACSLNFLRFTMLEEFCMVGVFIYHSNKLVIYGFFKLMLLKFLSLCDAHYNTWNSQ